MRGLRRRRRSTARKARRGSSGRPVERRSQRGVGSDGPLPQTQVRGGVMTVVMSSSAVPGTSPDSAPSTGCRGADARPSARSATAVCTTGRPGTPATRADSTAESVASRMRSWSRCPPRPRPAAASPRARTASRPRGATSVVCDRGVRTDHDGRHALPSRSPHPRGHRRCDGC
jgi:hypothetical protein